ncbi:hypothetical protein OQA88_13336 [Cercophora sp. LCS_1]
MLKKCSCSAALLPIATVLHGALTAFQLVMLRAGTGSAGNRNNEPTSPSWYTVRIDADQYTAAGATTRGLPDPNDSDAWKDFYTIYPSLYCSGYKDTNGAYKTESMWCSPWGHQFDLQWAWRDAGIDLVKNDYVGNKPRTIFFSLTTGTTGTILSVVTSLLGLFWYWGKMSFAALIANSITSQQFISGLVSNARNVKPTSGTGRISASAGPVHGRVSWVMAFVALADALLITFIVWRGYKRRKEIARAGSSPGSGGGGPLGGVYQYLAPGGKTDVHSESRVELIAQGGKAGVGGRVSVTTQQSAYEPMRHRGV